MANNPKKILPEKFRGNLKPGIDSYLDYREYLKDILSFLKKKSKQVTQRSVLQKMGVTSSGFLANVMGGKKNLNPEHTTALSEALNLTLAEKKRFKLLIQFAQAKSLIQKKQFLDKLLNLHKVHLKTLNPDQWSLFSKWQYVYIRELINVVKDTSDLTRLGQLLDPAISLKETEEALSALTKMGLIKKDKQGRYKQTDDFISTGDEVKSVQLASFHIKTMELAKRALEKIPAVERDLSVLSITLSDKSFSKIKKEMQSFRKKILSIVREEPKPTRVYQMNLHLFPVSKKEGEK